MLLAFSAGIWFLGDYPKARLMAHWNQRSFRLLQRTRVHLSPLLGALYLAPLDRAMEQRVSRGRLVSYVRYMDDFVLLASTRWQLRRAIAEVHAVTGPIGLRMHPDKRFIGSLHQGLKRQQAWRQIGGGHRR